MLLKCSFVLQLKIFDLNNDGKLCLAEMARFVLSSFKTQQFLAVYQIKFYFSMSNNINIITGYCQTKRTFYWNFRLDIMKVEYV